MIHSFRHVNHRQHNVFCGWIQKKNKREKENAAILGNLKHYELSISCFKSYAKKL